MMLKEQAKTITIKLSDNKAWHAYVDWFWKFEDWRANVSWLANGFEAGYRAQKNEGATNE